MTEKAFDKIANGLNEVLDAVRSGREHEFGTDRLKEPKPASSGPSAKLDNQREAELICGELK